MYIILCFYNKHHRKKRHSNYIVVSASETGLFKHANCDLNWNSFINCKFVIVAIKSILIISDKNNNSIFLWIFRTLIKSCQQYKQYNKGNRPADDPFITNIFHLLQIWCRTSLFFHHGETFWGKLAMFWHVRIALFSPVSYMMPFWYGEHVGHWRRKRVHSGF